MAKAKNVKATASGTLKRKDAHKQQTARKSTRKSIRKAGRKSHTTAANKARAKTRGRAVGATWTVKKNGKTITKKKTKNGVVTVSTKTTKAKSKAKKA